MNKVLDQFVHRWLRVPYTLHSRVHHASKRPRATIVMLHGIGNTGDVWKETIAKLPEDVRIITIDLLGFGRSPRPKWARYNAKTQARSVLATLFKYYLGGQIIVVGHSLGSLVSVEIAKRYPLLIKQLILCSPPFYVAEPSKRRLLPHSDSILRKIYTSVAEYPEQFIQLSNFAVKYNLMGKSYNVTKDNVSSYMATLRSMIINQTSFDDALKLRIPVHIIRGALDPLVIPQNLKALSSANPHITLSSVVAAHEVQGLYIPAIVKRITAALPPRT